MNLQNAKWRAEAQIKHKEKLLYKQLLNSVSQGISFSEEVICEMGPISFRKLDFSWLFQPTGSLAPSTGLKKKKKHRNKETHSNSISLIQEEGRTSSPAVNPQASFTSLDQSEMYNMFRKTKQFEVLNLQSRMKESCTGVVKDQSNGWQNKAGQLLQLRKQHRTPGSPLSPMSTNVLNRFNNTTVTVKPIEIPQAPRLQDILNPPASRHPSEKTFEQNILSETDKVVKAKKRWKNQPTKTDSDYRPLDFNTQDSEVPKLSVADLSALYYAVDNWRKTCNIKLPLRDVSIEGLRGAVNDPNYPVRMEAIVICALGAVNGPQEELDPGRAGWKVKAEPQELQAVIDSVLDDPVRRVQTAAAVCQCAMRASSTHTRDILRNTIKQDPPGRGTDSWAAAQCLAIEGDVSQAVIQRLLSQLFCRDSPSDQEQAMTLLSNISSKTTLVRSLLAEELNNANWKSRVQACTSISQLKSPINKDICNKLIHIMWKDWSCAVRHAAALALSKLDSGKKIHKELSMKLKEGPNACRLEALMFIGQLNIMTPKLLPTFLQCFNDDFKAVRKQACLTAASLMMEDQSVQDQLIHLVQNEPLWEVKVEAINALGKTGHMNAALWELLVWAVHYEEEPSVRIAACEALSTSDAKGPELQHFLQEHHTLETNAEVQRHIECLLKKHGYSLQKARFRRYLKAPGAAFV